eukprot:s358_g14.t2
MLLPMCRRIVARRRSQASYFKLGTSSLPSSSFRAGWQAASAPRPPTKAPWDRFKAGCFSGRVETATAVIQVYARYNFWNSHLRQR